MIMMIQNINFNQYKNKYNTQKISCQQVIYFFNMADNKIKERDKFEEPPKAWLPKNEKLRLWNEQLPNNETIKW